MTNQVREYIERIVIDNNQPVKKRIDRLLELDCSNYTCLGIDSTIEERQSTKEISKYIYNTISTLDSNEGKLLLKTFDI